HWGEAAAAHPARGGLRAAGAALSRRPAILQRSERKNTEMATQHRRGMPLRVGLVAATLILVTCGLVASGIAVTSILRHSLISRIDQTLLDASRSWAQAPRRHSAPPYEGPDPGRPPSKFYVRGVGTDGTPFTAINDRNSEPALPPDNDV